MVSYPCSMTTLTCGGAVDMFHIRTGIIGRGRSSGYRSSTTTAATAASADSVRALVHGALEEVVLQRVVRRDACACVVVEHACDEVLEFEVVTDSVTLFPGPPTTGTTSTYTQDVLQLPRSWCLVLQEWYQNSLIILFIIPYLHKIYANCLELMSNAVS